MFQAQDDCSGPKPEFPFQIQDVEPPRPPESDITTAAQSLTPSQPQNMATTGLNQQEQPEARVGGGVSGINPYMKGYQQNHPSSAIYSSPVQPVITQASSNYGQPTSSLGYQHPTMSYPTVGIPPNTGGMLPQPISTVPSQPIGFPTQPAVFNPTDISPQPSWNVTAPAATVAPPISGVQPRPPDNNSYNTDLAESWNDPPTLKAKKKVRSHVLSSFPRSSF